MTADGFLPYGRHTVDETDIAAVVAALRGPALTGGPAVPAFEAALANATGAAHAVACASGTAALHLALTALDLPPGTGVVVPSLTFVATANAVRMAGGRVIFADVDPGTGLMGPEHLEDALTRAGGAVGAVIPVHLNGQAADLAALAGVAGDRPLIDDACHALGTTVGEHAIGASPHARATCFSFHPVKTIAMGEGGAITTADAALARRVAELRNHGLIRDPARFRAPDQAFDDQGSPNPWYYEIHELGFNYRASDLHCALGTSQLARLDRFVARRRELARRYDQYLRPLAPQVRPVPRVAGGNPAWHLYVVLCDFPALEPGRASLMTALRARGIGTQVHYLPVHRQPWYRDTECRLDLPGADTYYRACLSLPLFPDMTDQDVETVVHRLNEALRLSR